MFSSSMKNPPATEAFVKRFMNMMMQKQQSQTTHGIIMKQQQQLVQQQPHRCYSSSLTATLTTKVNLGSTIRFCNKKCNTTAAIITRKGNNTTTPMTTKRYLSLEQSSSSRKNDEEMTMIMERTKNNIEAYIVEQRRLGFPSNNHSGINEELFELDFTTRMKNLVLAFSLLGSTIGIFFYSIKKVGQPGGGSNKNSTSISEDPLAILKDEAAMARLSQERQQVEEQESAKILRQYEAGEYDPDRIEDDDEDDEDRNPSSKKPWWKFF